MQGFEVIGHRARRDIFTGRFLQDLSPIFGAAFPENAIEPFPDFLVIGIITGLRRLFQDFARDVIVELELEDRREGVVVIVGRVIVDVCLGRGVAELFAAR